MASNRFEMVGLVLVLVMLCGGAVAQSGCSSALVSLSPCLNYVSGNSSTPSSSCCSQLANVVQSEPRCLCALLNGGGSTMGININQTLALALPGACNVQTPPASQCNGGANGPATSPPSPSGSSNETPNSSSNSPSGAGSGSKTTPETSAGTSDGPKKDLSFVILFVAALASSLFA